MATLQEQRQAIAQGMANSRAATASAERQAISQAMVARRTGKSIKDDLNALETPPRKRAQLRDLEKRGARPATRGVGSWDPKNQPASGGGIASPLTEKTKTQGGQQVADREYYPAGLVSSDGLLVLPATKRQTFIDANGVEHDFNFATPGVLP